mmetsp:Transcript_4861/g.16815  ORF Transcript_4861/g.16815 Transcript_4861/m.16815 type:complete len:604 (+) Transcript_4861:113-1924(+)
MYSSAAEHGKHLVVELLCDELGVASLAELRARGSRGEERLDARGAERVAKVRLREQPFAHARERRSHEVEVVAREPRRELLERSLARDDVPRALLLLHRLRRLLLLLRLLPLRLLLPFGLFFHRHLLISLLDFFRERRALVRHPRGGDRLRDAEACPRENVDAGGVRGAERVRRERLERAQDFRPESLGRPLAEADGVRCRPERLEHLALERLHHPLVRFRTAGGVDEEELRARGTGAHLLERLERALALVHAVLHQVAVPVRSAEPVCGSVGDEDAHAEARVSTFGEELGRPLEPRGDVLRHVPSAARHQRPDKVHERSHPFRVRSVHEAVVLERPRIPEILVRDERARDLKPARVGELAEEARDLGLGVMDLGAHGASRVEDEAHIHLWLGRVEMRGHPRELAPAGVEHQTPEAHVARRSLAPLPPLLERRRERVAVRSEERRGEHKAGVRGDGRQRCGVVWRPGAVLARHALVHERPELVRDARERCTIRERRHGHNLRRVPRSEEHDAPAPSRPKVRVRRHEAHHRRRLDQALLREGGGDVDADDERAWLESLRRRRLVRLRERELGQELSARRALARHRVAQLRHRAPEERRLEESDR